MPLRGSAGALGRSWERRLREARLFQQTLGFLRAFIPDALRGEAGDVGMALTAVGPVTDIVAQIAPKSGAIGPKRVPQLVNRD